jgi:hypothetical protein
MNRKMLKTLDSAIANLSRLQGIEGLELAHNRLLRKALKELKAHRKAGKRPPQRLYLAVQLICQVMCEEFVSSAKEV